MRRTIIETHERTLEAPAATVGALLGRLGADDDPLWPVREWPAVRFDRPLGAGADGGHGFVRYRVRAYEPGRRVVFDFHPEGSGWHELSVRPLGEGRCVLRHTMEVPMGPLELLGWFTGIRPVHRAVVRGLLDNASRAVGEPFRPVRPSLRVRLLRRALTDGPAAVPVPPGLARSAFPRPGFADAWQLPRHPSLPADPALWYAALRPPRVVRVLMACRRRLVRAVGIRPEPPGPFPVLATTDREILAGHDADHLDFRLSLTLDPAPTPLTPPTQSTGPQKAAAPGPTAASQDGSVTLVSTVRLNNRRGRAYFAVIRPFHRYAARALLRSAHRAVAASAAGPAPRDPSRPPSEAESIPSP